MARKSKPFIIEEQPGDRYPDLETVQKLVVQPFANELANMVQSMLVSGELTIEDRRVIISNSLKGKEENEEN